MHPALAIAAKDLRQRLRDRSAVILGFVAPLAIAALMSVAFTNADRFHVAVGYASADRGPVAAALHDVLTSRDLRDTFTVKAYPDAAAVRRATDNRRVDAGIVVPANFSSAVTSANGATVTVLANTDSRLSADVVRSVVDAFLARINADRLAVGAAVVAGAPPTRVAELAHRAESMPLPVSVTQQSGHDKQLKTISYYAPAMGIFFVLFAVSFGARGWFLERGGGTLDRMMAAPLRMRTLLLGKALATFAYALGSLGTTVIVSSLAFGANWGNPLAVAILCVAMSVSIVALTMLVMAVARSERQSDGLSAILTFALAIAGGNFILSSKAPDSLRSLALWTPNGWALRGFTDLATGATATSTVLAPLLGILACTAVAVGVTAVGARRMVQR